MWDNFEAKLATFSFLVQICPKMDFGSKFKKSKCGFRINTSKITCVPIFRQNKQLLNGIKVRVFFEKNIEKKHLRHYDKSYCYFSKSNIPVTNLIVGFTNMIKRSKNMSLKKNKIKNRQFLREMFSPNTDNFLTFFVVFEWGRILESAMDK